jgi:hypothetical protein
LIAHRFDDALAVLHDHDGRVLARENARIAVFQIRTPNVIEPAQRGVDLVGRDPLALGGRLGRFGLERALRVRQPCALLE